MKNGLGDKTKFSSGGEKGGKVGSKKIRVNLDLGDGVSENQDFDQNSGGEGEGIHAGGLLCRVARDSRCDGPKVGSLGSCYLQALYS